MKPSSCFPGIIGPKLELTAYVDIFNMQTGEKLSIDRMDCYQQSNALNEGGRHYMCLHNANDVKYRFRKQKAVCHAGIENEAISSDRYFIIYSKNIVLKYADGPTVRTCLKTERMENFTYQNIGSTW